MKKGKIFKAVESQYSEMDAMDIIDKEWSIFDEAFLTTEEVIEALIDSKRYEHRDLAYDFQNILDCQDENDEES